MSKYKSSAPIPYFSISRNNEEKTAEIYIFGDIVHNKGGLDKFLQASSDESSYNLARQVESIPKDYAITVHINSNGGEVKEGLGIYNVLKSRNVTTICEGFAASAASIVFAAGKVRIMQPASLLFIHQAHMTGAGGNADDFQKAADDLRTITEAAVTAYKESGLAISDDLLYAMLKEETWITPKEAVAYGFATQIAEPSDGGDTMITNDAMESIMKAVKRPTLDAGEAAQAILIENEGDGVMDVLKDFTATAKKYEDIMILAAKAFALIDNDPELLSKLKMAASQILGTGGALEAQAGTVKKGFFGFAR